MIRKVLLFVMLTAGISFFSVAQATLNIHLAYDNTILSPMRNTFIQLKLNGNVVDTATTDTTGHCNFYNLSAGTYQCIPVCTIPLGGINASDALSVAKNFVHLNGYILTGLHLAAAEVNGVGFIPNALDALLIIHVFTGSLPDFPVPRWQYETININVAGNGTINQQIKMICTGDVNGSYIPL